MSQPFRLPVGGAIDRGRPISFHFDGRHYEGYEGDTLASALLANGVCLVARSFKFHRPRGIVAAGIDEPNALVAVGKGTNFESNVQATLVPLKDGLDARSLNAWPRMNFDVGSFADLLHRFLPAGFYYKTFMWPDWSRFEWAIRRAAGVGHAPHRADPSEYPQVHLYCDVLVIGGGGAGLAAARAASTSGVDVVLLESVDRFGCALVDTDRNINGVPARDWISRIEADLRVLPNVTLLCGTTAIGEYANNYVLAVGPNPEHPSQECLLKIRAERLVLATGAIEQPLVFPDNDRPGIMLAGAAERYAQKFAVRPGDRVVLATNCDDGHRIAESLRRCGVPLQGVLDTRENMEHGVALSLGEVPTYFESRIVRTWGRNRVAGIEFEFRSQQALRRKSIEVDAVLMSGGSVPNIALFRHEGGKARFDAKRNAFLPQSSTQTISVIGLAAGEHILASALAQGWAAGTQAAEELTGSAAEEGPRWETSGQDMSPWAGSRVAGGGASQRQWVDFHNDVTVADIALAVRENLTSVEHVKRYTTLGMAPDQGKISNANGIAQLALETNRSPEDIGTTTFRPPHVPVQFGVIAGLHRDALFQPAKQLPTHDLLRGAGAVLDDYGPWKRPVCFPKPGETDASAIAREVTATRTSVGVMDYSSLGKIEILGPDALTFLNRFTTTDLRTLKAGRARYNLMLNEMGVVIDDGIVSRLGEEHFLIQTTSGAGERIREHFERWHQTEWPRDRVHVVDISSAWGVILVSGPRAREIMGGLETDLDFSNAAFPHMSVRVGTICGRAARTHRVSFTGELTYELSVPWGYAASLWKRLSVVATPLGLESLQVMRIEKGYIHVGTDTDGTTVPEDIGYGAMAARKPVDFIGKRSLRLADAQRFDRFQLVGLNPKIASQTLPVGGHVIAAAQNDLPAETQGYVTSSVWSPTLGRAIALARIVSGRARLGRTVRVFGEGRWSEAEIVSPHFHDPDGLRQDG